MRDARVVEATCRSCEAVGTETQQRATVRWENRHLSDVSIEGYSANVASMLNIDLEAGRFFTPTEDAHATPVAVIGYDVKDQIFPTINPIGRTIYIQGYPLRVIGLQTKLGKVLGQNK